MLFSEVHISRMLTRALLSFVSSRRLNPIESEVFVLEGVGPFCELVEPSN